MLPNDDFTVTAYF